MMIDARRAAELDAQAKEILRINDRGGFTVPTARLYPINGTGIRLSPRAASAKSTRIAPGRSWIPSSRPSGRTAWSRTSSSGATIRITFQARVSGNPEPRRPAPATRSPPVAATVARDLYEAGPKETAEARARALFPKLLAWHRWFHSYRDPDGLGVIAIAHPWESGRDNSPDWDAAMAKVDTSGVEPYERRDTDQIHAEMRPTKEDYDRYVALVQFGRDCAWDPEEIARNGPLFVADPGLTFVLLRADRDLLALADALGEQGAIAEIQGWIARAETGVFLLWNAEAGAYCAATCAAAHRATAFPAFPS